MTHWRVTSESLGVDHIFEGSDDGLFHHLTELSEVYRVKVLSNPSLYPFYDRFKEFKEYRIDARMLQDGKPVNWTSRAAVFVPMTTTDQHRETLSNL